MTTNEISKNIFHLTYELPIGYSAEQSRLCGCIIPEDIADCAIYMGNGIFEWYTLKMDILKSD